jgi:hypothetical protein
MVTDLDELISILGQAHPARCGVQIMITALYQKIENAFGVAALQLGTQTPRPFPKFEKGSAYHVHPLTPEIKILIGSFSVFFLVLAVNTIRSTMRQRKLNKLLPQNFTSQRKRRAKIRKQRKNAQKIQKNRQT